MIQTIKMVSLVDSIVDNIYAFDIDMADGAVPLIVGEKVKVNIGDVYSNGVFTIDPDAAKKAAIKAEVAKAVAALQVADDKASVLKALADATAAVQPLADVPVKP